VFAFACYQIADSHYNFIISSNLSGLKRLGSFYVNNSVGATTFFGSSKQRKIAVTGLPSKVDLFIVCYATNTAGNSVISTVLPFSWRILHRRWDGCRIVIDTYLKRLRK
jgi:hypothetical protein